MDVASLVEDEAVRERACFEADLRAPLGIARLPPTAALDAPDAVKSMGDRLTYISDQVTHIREMRLRYLEDHELLSPPPSGAFAAAPTARARTFDESAVLSLIHISEPTRPY